MRGDSWRDGPRYRLAHLSYVRLLQAIQLYIPIRPALEIDWMETLEVELTDPAKELTALSQLILDAPPANNTLEGLSKCIDIPVDDAEFLEVISAIQRRLTDAEALAIKIDDTDFDQDLKTEVLSALRSFRQILNPKTSNNGWDQARNAFLPPKNVQALRFFSQTARRYRPLRVIPSRARAEALKEITEIIQEVQRDRDLQAWMKPLLVSSLERTHLVLRHLRFFGHEVAISELFLAHQKLSVVREEIETTNTNPASFWKAMTILSVVGNLFVLPDQSLAAFDHYKSWIAPLLRVVTQQQIPATQRLLPSPVAIETKSEDESTSVSEPSR